MSQIISMRDIERISRESARILYGSDAVDQPNDPNHNESDIPAVSQIPESSSKLLKPSVIDRNGANFQLKNTIKIIDNQSSNDPPFLFRSEAAALANIRGAATLQAAEKEALMVKVIRRHEIAKAKTNKILWEITERGYELLKKDPPNWKSKGDYRHKFCAHRIAYSFNQQGYRTTIEYRRPNGKLVDLHLSRDNESIYTEICASYPVEKELVNIEKNLEGSPTPSSMILCVTDRAMKERLKWAVTDFASEFLLPCPVEVILAGDIIDPLELIR